MNETLHAVRMSNRQFGQLKYLLSAPKGTIGIDEVAHMNQLTLGGNKRRKWIAETSTKDGITVTKEGREALKAFENGDFLRKVSSMKFSSFLSLDVYDDSGRRQRTGTENTRKKSSHSETTTVRGMRRRNAV